MNGVVHGAAGAPPAGPATAPGATEATLLDVLAELRDDKQLLRDWYVDPATGVFYRETITLDQDTGASVSVYHTFPGVATVATLPATVVPLSTRDLEQVDDRYVATASGTGYALGDQLARISFVDTSSVPPSVAGMLWRNLTTSTWLAAAPPLADYALPTSAPSVVAGAFTRLYRATVATAEYAAGDVLAHEFVLDAAAATWISSQWYNRSAESAPISTPGTGEIESVEERGLDAAVASVDNTAGLFAAPVVGSKWVVRPEVGTWLTPVERNYRAVNAATGYSVGDVLVATRLVDPLGNVAAEEWSNLTTGLAVSVPPIADITPVDTATAATPTVLPVVSTIPTANVTAVDSIIVPANPARKSLMLQNTGTVDCRIQIGAAATPTTGAVLSANGGVIAVGPNETIVGDVHAITAAGTTTISIFEAI